VKDPGQDEKKAIVYVWRAYINDREIEPKPKRNAAETDLAAMYAIDHLDSYPGMRERFERREKARAKTRDKSRIWATKEIDHILYDGIAPLPRRPRYTQVLRALLAARANGMNRKEICRLYGIDGGRISGAMTMLHDAGIIFPLTGVLR
jgi:hypothetical protein